MRSALIFSLMMTATLSLPLAAMAQTPEDDDAAAKPAISKPAAKAALPKPVKAAAKPAASPTDYVVLKVNGDEVRRSEVMELWASLFEGRQAPDFDTQEAAIKQNVLTGLLSEKLVLQQAEKSGIESEPAMRKKLDMLRKQLLIQEWMARTTKDKVSEEALKAFYEKNAAKDAKEQEVHVRHILVKTADEAKAAYDRIKKGEAFEAVAKELSADKGSGSNGGDIGWVNKGKVVPEFADAAMKLKDKEVSKPVKTAFGWHIIQVLEHRTRQPAAFSEVHDQVAQQALGQATRETVETLLKKADIEYFSPTGDKLPFDRSLPGDVAPR